MTVIIALGILSVVAVPKFLGMREDAMAAADEESIGAIQSALSVAFMEHRVRDAPSSEWITWPGKVKDAMSNGELPGGIELGLTMEGYKLRDRRGSTYKLTPETASSPAVLTKDAEGAPGFS